MTAISSIFSWENQVVPYRFKDVVPLENVQAPHLLYGVELEIERVDDPDAWVVAGMTHTEDGSLRNNGREFITKPMTLSYLAHTLRRFKEVSKVSDKNYSDRTSVHVHTNVRDLSLDQLKTILVLYQLFEGLLFEFAGTHRKENVFCVPWSETILNHNIVDTLGKDTPRLWQKYTALNLVPMCTLGTIEWRHLEGTPDMERIITWCRIIGCFYRWCTQKSFTETVQMVQALNTNSEYERVFHECFQELGAVLWTRNARELLEEGVINVKLISMKEKNTKASTNTIIDNLPAAAERFEQIVRNYEAARARRPDIPFDAAQFVNLRGQV